MPAARKPGRPTSLTQEVHAAIVSALASGAYPETAAAVAGVSRAVFYLWLKQGRKAKSGRYRRFADAVQRAIAQAEMVDMLVIKRAGQGGAWQAAAWRLERRFPKKYSRRTIIDAPAREQAPSIIRTPLPGPTEGSNDDAAGNAAGDGDGDGAVCSGGGPDAEAGPSAG